MKSLSSSAIHMVHRIGSITMTTAFRRRRIELGRCHPTEDVGWLVGWSDLLGVFLFGFVS